MVCAMADQKSRKLTGSLGNVHRRSPRLKQVMPEPRFRLTHLSDGAAEDPQICQYDY